MRCGNSGYRYEQCFRLVTVYFQFFVPHPRLNVLGAELNGLGEFVRLLWRVRFLQLGLVSKSAAKVGVPVVVGDTREGCGQRGMRLERGAVYR